MLRGSMTSSFDSIQALTDSELLASTQRLVLRDHALTADLLVHLGEIDLRRLYLERAYPSMFAFCMGELGMSEDATYARITVARVAQRFPAVLASLRTGRMHLTGLRILGPHLSEANCGALLEEAEGKSKQHIEEIVARIAPKPAVLATIRKLPTSGAQTPPAAQVPIDPKPAREAQPLLALPPALSTQPVVAPSQALAPSQAPAPSRPLQDASILCAPQHRPRIHPLDADTFRVQFTATQALRGKLREAQGLLRHQVPGGDLAQIVELALDHLLAATKKKRFATVGKRRRAAVMADQPQNPGTAADQPRPAHARPAPAPPPKTRHIPAAIRRAVFERDGGRCAFIDDRGRRCHERGGLELDHLDGFARTKDHSVDRIRLACRAHNRHAADRMYGRAFMEQKVAERRRADDPTRSGTSREATLP